MKREIYTPPRTPWAEHQATETRAKVGKVAAYALLGLLLIGIVCGWIGA